MPRSVLNAVSALPLLLAACASGGGDLGDTPDPIIDEGSGAVAAPRNLVLEEISFRSGADHRGVDETYDVSARTLLARAEANGALTYADSVQTGFGTGQSLAYDADTNQFTVSIDYTDEDRAGEGPRVVTSGTFGPMLLMTPNALDDLQNGLPSVYLATQPHAFPVSDGLIGGDVLVADGFLTDLGSVAQTETGFGVLAGFRRVTANTGYVGDAETERDLGSLPLLVSFDPARFGAPDRVAGNQEAAGTYLRGLNNDDFVAVQNDAPNPNDDAVLAGLIGYDPGAFGVRDRTIDAAGAADLLAAMYEVGGRRIDALLTLVDRATARIEAGPGFYYEADGVTYYQYRTDEGAAPTRFAAMGEWNRTDAEGNIQFGHMVFGQRTDPSEMPQTGTATYEGTITGSILRQNTVEQLRGGLNVETDFATGGLTMTMDANIAYRNGEGVTEFIDYAEFEGRGDIDGAAFSGVMDGTVDRDAGEDAQDVLIGSFEGEFFGPTAQEVGGTFEFTGTDAAAAGAFVGADPTSDETGD